MKKWITLKKEFKFQAHVFKHIQLLRRSPDSGNEGLFDRIDCHNWVNMVVKTTEGKIIMVRQYRHGVDDITEEIPGGAVDPGEDPLVAAQRELLEETGYKAENWRQIGVTSPNPAFMSNKCFVYYADEAQKVSEQNLDHLEEIEVVEMDLDIIREKISSGSLSHALVIVAFYYFDRMSI